MDIDNNAKEDNKDNDDNNDSTNTTATNSNYGGTVARLSDGIFSNPDGIMSLLGNMRNAQQSPTNESNNAQQHSHIHFHINGNYQ